MLLSTCQDVVSADIPSALDRIACSISASALDKRKFLEMSRSQAAAWLKSNDSVETHELFVKFLDKHGHRCVREAEISEKTWNQEPEKVADALRTILLTTEVSESNRENKPVLTMEKAIDNMETQVSMFRKWILKHLLKQTREAVRRREWAKNLLMKNMYFDRVLLDCLAKKLVEIGHLPEEELIFYFPYWELDAIVAGPQPKLISKAMRRRRLLPVFEKMEYDEIFCGYPKPVSNIYFFNL